MGMPRSGGGGQHPAKIFGSTFKYNGKMCMSDLKLTKLNIIILAMLGTLRDKKKHISRMTERSTNKARCRVACLRLTSLIDKQ